MMKSWHSLIRYLEGWREKYLNQNILLGHRNSTKHSKFSRSTSLRQRRRKDRKNILRDLLAMLILSIIAITSVVGYRFYNQPQLTVGKISPLTIKAPYSGEFEDNKTTIEKRKEIQTGIVPILKQDENLTREIQSQLAIYLNSVDELRKLTEPFPFFNPEFFSLSSQQYIRFCPEEEFKAVLASVTKNFEARSSDTDNNLSLEKRPDFNPKLQKVASELQTYREQTSEGEFNTLIAQITLTRYRYSQAWKKLAQKKIVRLDDKDIVILLDLTEKDWKTTKNTVALATDRILTQGIPLGMPSNLLDRAISAQLNPNIPKNTELLAHSLLLEILEPNLEEDKDATRNIAEKAAMAINTVIVEIEQGEVIVEQGARITQSDFVLLDGFRLSQRGINWNGLQLCAAFVSLMVGIFLVVQRRVYTSIRHRDYFLLCLLSLSAPLLSVFDFPHTSLPAIGLLVSSFYSPSLAVCQVALVTGLVMFSNQVVASSYLLSGCAGGFVAAIFAGRLRSREAIARLGIMVGLSQATVYLISNLIASDSPATNRSAILPDASICGIFGVAWSVVAIGISPYLERFIDLITPIRLA